MFNRYIETSDTRPLPLSGNKYTVSISGVIRKSDGVEVTPNKNKLGDLVVMIDWLDGWQEQKVAFLVAHAFKPVKMPFIWWNKISVFFANGDRNDLHPANLVWKFPIGLGSDKYNGFAFIPMHSRYMINRDGVVYDTNTRKILNAHFNKGYFSYALLPDVGPRVTLKRHRALCLAFTDYPAGVDSLDVNHKNGIPGADNLENLEWMTSSENRIHAIINGLTLVNKPVIARNLLTGNEVEFFSLNDACKKLKINEKKLSVCLGQVDGTCVHGNFELRYKYPEHAVIGNLNKCPILVRDLRTGVITEYESIVSCAEKTGKTKFAIAGRIETPTSNLHADYLQFKRKTDLTPWYIPTDYEREILETSWSKKILVRDVITKKTHEFNTQREAAKYIGIAESTIVQWLTSPNQPVFKHRLNRRYIQIKRKSDECLWREVINPEEEYLLSLCKKSVLVRNIKTNKIKEFGSATGCAKHFGLLPTTLNWRLKSRGQTVYDKKFQFKYKNDNMSFAIIDK